MKKVIIILLIFVLLSLTTACKTNNPSSSTSTPLHTKQHNVIFPHSQMVVYEGKANVPEYTVLPGLENVTNKNQFQYGTDWAGNYYFSLELSQNAINKIEQNGFVVIDSLSYEEYYSRYESNRYNYVPSFITTDSTLHTFHLMYDYVLKDVERSKLADYLKNLSLNMVEASYQQYLEVKGTEFENAALRNVAYFTIGGKLLDDSFPIKNEVATLVEKELSLINEHSGIAFCPLVNYPKTDFESVEDYMVDYSQFIPRGHYTQSSELEAYFKASMWYGQITFRSAYPDEVRSALLMTSALKSSETFKDWYNIFEIINFFVGECDDITPIDYIDTLTNLYDDQIDSLEKITDNSKFDQAIEIIKQMPPPAINSIPIFEEEIQPDKDKAITGFRFLGQRFTIDASIFQKLIARETKDRMLPNALDIPAAFGSDEAYTILQQNYNVNTYPDYDGNLKKAREYINDVKDYTWTSNLYWSWINTLRPLAGNIDRTGYPFFMQNSAWTRKELNTFLGSWTELKHDTLLYAKQPMSEMGAEGGETPPPPDDRGYVEPNPELFGRLSLLVKQTKDGLLAADAITTEASDALENLYNISSTLETISLKELENTELTEEEYDFIRNYGGALEHIWDAAKKDELDALKAQYGYANKEQYLYQHPDAIIADVATDPNGYVLEEATGYAKPIVVAFPRDGEVVLGVGTVFSQYEFTVFIDERMTDGEWHERLRNNDIPEIAEWKKDFIVNE
ncbi:MAG: DUF3160 domain-containing protein [Erysipelotrichaceae bacterium]|nr:DUF3160 domain-containing protein [Erysipelotrichaceae bacterium]